MREIKFRGKRLDNGEWVKGSGIRINKGGTVFIYDEISLRWYEVDPETVGQYSGLKDKNKWEIYEGDIVEFLRVRKEGTTLWGRVEDTSIEKLRGLIKFKEGGFYIDGVADFPFESYLSNWYFSESPQGYHSHLHCHAEEQTGYFQAEYEDLEVIGNIYDNPELLREV